MLIWFMAGQVTTVMVTLIACVIVEAIRPVVHSVARTIAFNLAYAAGMVIWAIALQPSADLTLRWKPLRRAIYHSFVAHSEFIWARTAVSPQGIQFVGGPVATAPVGKAKPFGFYVSGDYQLGRRWFLGGRFDRSQRGQCLPTNPATTSPCPISVYPNALDYTHLLQDTGGSILLSYWSSEFSGIRAQLRRTRYGEGLTSNEIMFQFMFSMGAHGAHPF